MPQFDLHLKARAAGRPDNGADRRPPNEITTRIDAYLGLQLEVTSRLVRRSGGTDLLIRAETNWSRRHGPIERIVEMAILNPREAQKELANLRELIERESA